jgi:predicted ATPase with chaperone activity
LSLAMPLQGVLSRTFFAQCPSPCDAPVNWAGKSVYKAVRVGHWARQNQLNRFAAAGERNYSNAQMSSRQIRAYCDLGTDSERMLERAMQQPGLSARAHDRILKVARTIADMEGSPQIESKHIAEAIQYRTLDRTY